MCEYIVGHDICQTIYTTNFQVKHFMHSKRGYDSFATVGEIRVYRRADFQSGSRVLKKVF